MIAADGRRCSCRQPEAGMLVCGNPGRDSRDFPGWIRRKAGTVMTKKALMVVSFGTSAPEALYAITNIENVCRRAFPKYDFFRAFTSKMIIRKLKQTQGLRILNPEEVLDKLVMEDYEEVICQPTHVLKGREYEKILGVLNHYKGKIPGLKLGDPLLVTDEDYRRTAEIMMTASGKAGLEDEATVFMGHGTEHQANQAYHRMDDLLHEMGYDRAFVGTVEGTPSLDEVLDKLDQLHLKKAFLMPMLVVAGIHVREDLAGDQETSWKSRFRARGIQTEILLKGLGELDDIAQIYVDHIRQAKKLS